MNGSGIYIQARVSHHDQRRALFRPSIFDTTRARAAVPVSTAAYWFRHKYWRTLRIPLFRLPRLLGSKSQISDLEQEMYRWATIKFGQTDV